MGVVGEDVHELVPERGERRAAAQARMIVEEEGQLTERCELVRESLRQLHETAFEATAAVEKGRELSTELGGIAAQSADEIGEKDERILIPTLKGEPSGVPARGAQEIGVLGEESRLPKPRGRVYEREPMPLRAREPLEEPLSTKERQREGRRGVTRAIGCAARGGQAR